MNWIPLLTLGFGLIVVIGVIAALFTGGPEKTQIFLRRWPTMLGALLLVIAFLGMPWLKFGATAAGANLFRLAGKEFIQGAQEASGFLTFLVLVFSYLSQPTAWALLILAFTVALPALLGVVSLLVSLFHFFSGFSAPKNGNLFTAIQILGSLVALVLLLLQLGSIPMLGLGVELGAKLGYGLWVTLGSLVLLLIGGIVDYAFYWGDWNWEYAPEKA